MCTSAPTLFSSPPCLDSAQERASGLLELSKLWLFENCIGDAGAYALAELFHPTLLEVHLSHNSVTNKGRKGGGKEKGAGASLHTGTGAQ